MSKTIEGVKSSILKHLVEAWLIEPNEQIDFKIDHNSLNIDSLDFAELSINLEREYKIHLKDEDVINCKCLDDLALLVFNTINFEKNAKHF